MPLTFSAASGIAAFFVLISTILYWLAAFSVPYIDSIWYLQTRGGSFHSVHFGSFGFCKIPPDYSYCIREVGYQWDNQIPQDGRLTRAHVLVPLAAAFGTLTFLSLVASMRDFRGGLCGLLLLLITAFFSFLSLLVVVPTWAIAHRRFDNDGYGPKYGAAFIFVIVGWLLFLLAVPFVVIGWFRERRMRRDGTYGTHHTTTTKTTTRRKWF